MICGKTIYATRELANKAQAGHNGSVRHNNDQQKLIGAYFCEDCRGWHVHTKRKRSLEAKSKSVTVNKPTLFKREPQEFKFFIVRKTMRIK